MEQNQTSIEHDNDEQTVKKKYSIEVYNGSDYHVVYDYDGSQFVIDMEKNVHNNQIKVDKENESICRMLDANRMWIEKTMAK